MGKSASARGATTWMSHIPYAPQQSDQIMEKASVLGASERCAKIAMWCLGGFEEGIQL